MEVAAKTLTHRYVGTLGFGATRGSDAQAALMEVFL
jgi:hypothetical protein